MFMTFREAKQENTEKLVLLVYMYLDYIEIGEMIQTGVLRTDSNTKQMYVYDVSPILQSPCDILQTDLHLCSDKVFGFDDYDKNILINNADSPEKYRAKIIAIAEDITREEIIERLQNLVEEYTSEDYVDETYEDKILEEDEPLKDCFIVHIPSKDLDNVGRVLKTFDPTKFDIFLKNGYYLVYYAQDVKDLDRFNYFVSEFALEPCDVSVEFLDEHSDKKFSGEELLPVFAD